MDKIFGWIVPGIGALAVAGILLAWQWPFGASAPESGKAHTSATAHRQTSADVVAVHATRESPRKLQVMLRIDPGWHVNANPASLDFLIPTQIAITAQGKTLPTQVHYPPGQAVATGLEQPIKVYSGHTALAATLSEPLPGGPLKVETRVQACNDSGRCLPPATILARAAERAHSGAR